MSRFADDVLSVHLEVALATAAPSLLGGLADSDRRRRHAAIGEIARQLAERLRCFSISSDEETACKAAHPSLFPEDLGPIG